MKIGIEKTIPVKRSGLINPIMINYTGEPNRSRVMMMINRSTIARLQALESARIKPLTSVNRLNNEQLATKMLQYDHLWREADEPEEIRYADLLQMIEHGRTLTLAEKVDRYLPTCRL